jgi:hypothetical protein
MNGKDNMTTCVSCPQLPALFFLQLGAVLIGPSLDAGL